MRPCWPRSCRESRRTRGSCRSSNCTDLKKGERLVPPIRTKVFPLRLTVEADVARGTDEERLEQVVLRQLVDVLRDVDPAAADRDGAPEPEQAVEVEGGHLGVVTLKVGEVKVVRQRFLQQNKRHFEPDL